MITRHGKQKPAQDLKLPNLAAPAPYSVTETNKSKK